MNPRICNSNSLRVDLSSFICKLIISDRVKFFEEIMHCCACTELKEEASFTLVRLMYLLHLNPRKKPHPHSVYL